MRDRWAETVGQRQAEERQVGRGRQKRDRWAEAGRRETSGQRQDDERRVFYVDLFILTILTM